MTQENVEIARAVLDALNRGDGEAAFADATPDVELDLSRGMGPDAGVYVGSEARGWWDRFTDGWESISIEPSEFIPVDEHVVIPLTLRARGRDGIEVPSRPTWVVTFAGSRLARVGMYQERADAFEAVGLRENEKIVQGWLDAMRAPADEAAFEYLDPEVQIDWSRSDGPASGIYSGHDEARKLFEEYNAAFDEFWIEAHEFIPAGADVVVPNTSHFRGRGGLEVTARGALVFTVRDEKIVAITMFQNRADALLAVGLEARE